MPLPEVVGLGILNLREDADEDKMELRQLTFEVGNCEVEPPNFLQDMKVDYTERRESFNPLMPGTGIVAQPTELVVIPESASSGKSSQPIDLDADEAEEEEERESEPYKVMEVVSHFDEIEVWGHDQVPATDDTFVKAVREWVTFAELIHGSTKTSDTSNPTP